MKPEVIIATDPLGVTTIKVELGGLPVETIRLSAVVVEALREFLAEEVS